MKQPVTKGLLMVNKFGVEKKTENIWENTTIIYVAFM